MVEALSGSGVEFGAGLPGNAMLAATTYIYSSKKMRFIGVRHEQVAAAMAEGYARVTGRPAFCTGGAGPSAANLIIGVANAFRASVPMLVLTSNLDSWKLGRDSLNEWNQMDMFKPITKFSTQVKDPARISNQLRLALLASVSGRPGPVQVDVTTEVGNAEVKPKRFSRLNLGPTRVQASDEEVSAAVELLMSAERPLVIAGGGAQSSRADRRVRELVELLSIPIAVSGARGIVPEDHPLCFGPVGVWGHSVTNKLVESCDLVLGLGFRFSDDTTMGWKTVPEDAKIIQVDIDPTEIGRQYDATLGIVSDVDTFLGQLLRGLKGRARKAKEGWSGQRLVALQSALRKERDAFVAGPFDEKTVDKRVIVRDVMKLAREDAVIATGTGIHTRYACKVIVRRPRSFLRSGSFATMGFAFPAAMGAKVAAPERQVVCLDGDGDFLMTVQDLETAVREELPFVTIVFNNLSYGAYKFWPDKKMGVEFENPDFEKLADSFGAVGMRVTTSSQFGPALKELLKSDKPAILDAVVTRETNLPWY